MSPRKSGVRHSTKMWGARALMPRTVRAKWSAPPSGRSSRSTDVSTTYPTPHAATAAAVCSGSSGSGGAGVAAVLTAQKRQPRVQVSPSSMMVAVPDPPFQHSPTFGQRASSHTVCRVRERRWEWR